MELYIHIPFCRKKCRYCDFTSFAGMEDQISTYIDILIQETEINGELIKDKIDSIYLGGGTPSLIPPFEMERLLKQIKKFFIVDPNAECTAEANPGTLTEKWLDVAVACGINRISLGVQAGQDNILKKLGRIHSVAEVRHSVDAIRRAGIRNLSIDLMFGIPTQSLKDWKNTLEFAISLQPEHLSAYGLIPEEGTPLWEDLQAGREQLPPVEQEREMYHFLVKFLKKHHYEQYEISNFAHPGFECRHNIGYWNMTPYLGIGISAASMIYVDKTKPGTTWLRRKNTSSMDSYIQGVRNRKPVFEEEEWVSPKDARFETMMLGLRMNCGISEEVFLRMHGVSIEECYGEKLIYLMQNGMIQKDGVSWKLTQKGMDLMNVALVELMED